MAKTKKTPVDKMLEEVENYIEPFPELIASLRKEADDHDALKSLKYPVAYIAGDLHHIRAASLRAIADRVEKSWRKFCTESFDRKMRNTLVSIKKSFESKLYGKYPWHISDEGVIQMISKTLNEAVDSCS